MSNHDLDLSSPDKARKALADIANEQKRLKALNRDLSENMEKKTAELKKIQQRMSEMEAGSTAYTGSRGDGSAAQYVRRDGTVRLKGESTDEHAYMPGLLDDTPKSDWQKAFQDSVDDYNMVKAIRRNGDAPKARARMLDIARTAPVEVRKAFVDSSGSGGDFIPDVMLPQLERNLTLSRRLAAAFETVPMADKTVILPFLNTGFRPYKRNVVTTDDPAQFTSSSMSTTSRTITATGFSVRAQIDADASEDSILAVLPLTRQELIAAIVDGEEDSILNGDAVDLSSHGDAIASWNIRGRWGASGLGTSSDHRRAWTGLRNRALDITGASSAISEDLSGVLSLRSLLDSPHGVEGDCILVTSPEMYIKHLLNLEEVQTLDKFGANYTALSGQLAALAGMPIIVSEFMGADMNASGRYDGSTTDKTGIICVNRSRWKIGQRAGSTVEMDKDITRSVFDLVASSREIFYSVDAATKKNVAYGIDIST